MDRQSTEESVPPDDGQSRWRRFLRPSWEHRVQALRRQCWAVIVATCLLLLLVWCWPDDFDRTHRAYVAISWVLFLVRTFMFHGGLVLIAIAAAWAMARQWRIVAASFVAGMLMCAQEIGVMWPAGRPTPIAEANSLSVMSVNLLATNHNVDDIIGEIRSTDPDVLLLQEYADHWHDAMQTGIADRYPHVAYRCREDSFGVAVYSKIPFVATPDLSVPLGKADVPQVRAVIRLGNRDIALYNIHLLPPWGLDYTTETRRQFADLIGLLAREPLPVVMAGDFNFTHSCTQADRLADLGFRDTHAHAGRGRGTTWPNLPELWAFPSLMLDHIYLSNGLCATEHAVGKADGSDHRSITGHVGWCRN